jgi:predicted enzyme related to lactoylglutathione lyase
MGGTAPKSKRQPKDFISWFEIPANNFQQSVNFYNQIFGIDMETNSDENYAMAFFPVSNGVGGSIVAGPGATPGDSGPLLYLNAGKDLNLVLKHVENAGGRIVMSKTLINQESGYFAIFIDPEGNKIALYSSQ